MSDWEDGDDVASDWECHVDMNAGNRNGSPFICIVGKRFGILKLGLRFGGLGIWGRF